MSTRVHVEATTCQVCHRLCSAGAAEYHPYEFCRIYKAGGDPWNGRPPLTIHEITPGIKASLERWCREFWRSKYGTEVELP